MVLFSHCLDVNVYFKMQEAKLAILGSPLANCAVCGCVALMQQGTTTEGHPSNIDSPLYFVSLLLATDILLIMFYQTPEEPELFTLVVGSAYNSKLKLKTGTAHNALL